MLFYLAPMEGITGYIVRNAYAHYFPYIDKCFTPFIPAAKKMSKKIKQDLAAENNGQIRLVPQLIGNRADEFLMMIRQLKSWDLPVSILILAARPEPLSRKEKEPDFWQIRKNWKCCWKKCWRTVRLRYR